VFSGGQWVPANPIPDTILVNVGDLMQFWTADRYLATVNYFNNIIICFQLLLNLN
jgi:isopenicillin N synthase-like dioxygenase